MSIRRKEERKIQAYVLRISTDPFLNFHLNFRSSKDFLKKIHKFSKLL